MRRRLAIWAFAFAFMLRNRVLDIPPQMFLFCSHTLRPERAVMPQNVDKLKPASPEDIAESLAFALRSAGASAFMMPPSPRTLQRRLSEKNKALLSAMDRIESLANRDDLTGLPNRRSITAWLGEQMAICGRTGIPLSVGLLDLDHFKRINGAYGHLMGDRALQLFAKEALGAIRETDRLGRYGGEEFLIVLVGTALDGASEPLERIRSRVGSADWTIIDHGFRLTLTIGATEYVPAESVESLMRRADMALYLGKETDRNRVVLDSAPLMRLAAQSKIATA